MNPSTTLIDSPGTLIRDNELVTDDPWQIVPLPACAQATVRKQAGKPVLFKLTGENSVTAEQIAQTQIPATGKVIVPLSVWLARRDSLQARLENAELGIWLDTHELPEPLIDSLAHLNQLPLIAIHFERFADGRGYSLAYLLRTRYGFEQELRAIGDIFRDLLFYLRRCGFNAYQIRAGHCAQDALQGLRDFSEPYQHAADGLAPLWRRHARGRVRANTEQSGLNS